MYRIDNATAVPNGSGLPTPGAVGPNVNGFFTNGGGSNGTIVDGDWANAVQEEIAGVIEAASLVLSKTNHLQLLAAIKAINSWQALGTFHAAAVGSLTIPLSTAYRRFRVTLQNFTISVGAASLLGRFSSNGGSTWLTAASYTQLVTFVDNTPATSLAGTAAATSLLLSPSLPANSTGAPLDATYEIWPGTASAAPRLYGLFQGTNSPGNACQGNVGGSWGGASALMNALQVLVASGTMTGDVILEGML